MQKQLRQWTESGEYHKLLSYWIEHAENEELHAIASDENYAPIKVWLQARAENDVLRFTERCIKSGNVEAWNILLDCLQPTQYPTPEQYHRLAINNKHAELYPVYRALDWIKLPLAKHEQEHMLNKWHSEWLKANPKPSRKTEEHMTDICIGMMTFLSDHPMNGLELYCAANTYGIRLNPAQTFPPPKEDIQARREWIYQHAPLSNVQGVRYAWDNSIYAVVWKEILRHHPHAAEAFYLMHQFNWCNAQTSMVSPIQLNVPEESIEELRNENMISEENTAVAPNMFQYFEDTLYPPVSHLNRKNEWVVDEFRGHQYEAVRQTMHHWPPVKITQRLIELQKRTALSSRWLNVLMIRQRHNKINHLKRIL